MYCSVNRVDFDSGYNIETGLLKSQAHSARSGKQVDGNWSHLSHLNLSVGEQFDESGLREQKKPFSDAQRDLDVERFTLPNCEHAPPFTLETLNRFVIANLVALNFSSPKFQPTFWQSTFLASMAVPKTPVHKNDSAMLGQNYIGTPRQIFFMELKIAAPSYGALGARAVLGRYADCERCALCMSAAGGCEYPFAQYKMDRTRGPSLIHTFECSAFVLSYIWLIGKNLGRPCPRSRVLAKRRLAAPHRYRQIEKLGGENGIRNAWQPSLRQERIVISRIREIHQLGLRPSQRDQRSHL